MSRAGATPASRRDKKLGIHSVSPNTVKRILIANDLDPGPQRGVGTWDEFLKIHAATLWQCDFFTVRSMTPKGVRDLFVLVFLRLVRGARGRQDSHYDGRFSSCLRPLELAS